MKISEHLIAIFYRVFFVVEDTYKYLVKKMGKNCIDCKHFRKTSISTEPFICECNLGIWKTASSKYNERLFEELILHKCDKFVKEKSYESRND